MAFASDSSGAGAGATNATTAPPNTNLPSNGSGVGARGINNNISSSSAGGQRYDLVLVVSGVAIVIIAALLFVLWRTNQRAAAAARMDDNPRDVYKSSSDDEPLPSIAQRESPAHSINTTSTWKVGSSYSHTQPRASSLSSSSIRTIGACTTCSSSSRNRAPPLDGIWRDPVIAAARIPFDALKRDALLCRGAFGEVFAGTYNNQRVAIKRLLPETRNNIEHLEYFLLEVRLMAMLHHPRVVLFIGVAWDAQTDLCLVSELLARGDLRHTLQRWQQRGDATGWTATKLRIAVHVAEALLYLHSLLPKLIIHRDLKSRNILLDAAYNAKLSDFGVSREHSGHLTRTRTLTANVGSSLWMAPEILLGENYDETADIFSFGVVLSEVDTLALPYHDVTTPDGRRLPEPAVLHMVTIGSVQAQFSPPTCRHDADVVALGQQCLLLNWTARPRAQELVARLRVMLAEREAFEAAEGSA